MFDDAPADNLPVPRATVRSLVAQRNAIIESFRVAHAALVDSAAAVQQANVMLSKATPGIQSYNHHAVIEKSGFLRPCEIPKAETYMASARRLTDIDIWTHLISITDLDKLMDKKAKDQFRQQLMTDPPEVTEDNVFATLEQFILDSGMIFRRGIAECFSNLDRRFRSHDGWEIGSRIVLTYAFDSYGSWNYHRNHQDTFADIERVFRTLDGKDVSFCEMVEKLRAARGWGPQQTFIETKYFKVRAWKNGNAHIWFKRDDLLKQVNQLLGEYYGAPIPEDREPDADTGLYDAKTLPAKRYGFFPTPDDAAKKVMENVPLYVADGEPGLRVLEPSAGTGSLAALCARDKNVSEVDCVEIQPDLARALRVYGAVYNCDFLRLSPETTGLYDRVVMNPPFDRERDIDHVLHALKFLKPGGVLVAVMSAGTEFRNTKKSAAFRELMATMATDRWNNRIFTDLPPLSFASVGTNCNTIILKVRKP